MIDYENVNRNAPYKPDFLTQQIPLARQLLSQNVPIENIVQQTGLPRETVQQLFTSSQNISRPSMPSAQPSGIGTLTGEMDVGIADITSNIGTDIADYLTNELGFDPTMMDPRNPTDTLIEDLSYTQQLNLANANVALESEAPESEMEKLLNAQSDMEGLTDKEKGQITRNALREYFGDKYAEYAELIKTPDKGLPFLVAGLSLIESGTGGDTWGDALSKAAGAGLVQYKKDKAAWEGKITDLKLKGIIEADTQYFDLMKKSIEYDQKLNFERLTGVRKDYLVNTGTTTKIMPLNPVELTDAITLYGRSNIQEFDSTKQGALNNYIIVDSKGNSEVVGLTDEQATDYSLKAQNGQIRSITRTSNTGDSGGSKVQVAYKTKGQPNASVIYDAVTLDELADLRNNKDLVVFDGGKAGETVQVRDTTTDKIEYVPRISYEIRKDKYELIDDSVVTKLEQSDGPNITIGSATAIQNLTGNTKVIDERLSSTRKQTANRQYTTDLILDNVAKVKNLVMSSENPDLLFNNIAGAAVRPAAQIVTTLNILGDMFKTPTATNKDGMLVDKFDFVEIDENGKKVSSNYASVYAKVKKAVNPETGKTYWEDFVNSGIGNFLSFSQAEREVINNSLFNLAILSAASMGGTEETDMRAISDKDLLTQMQRVGRDAVDAMGFIASIDNFALETLMQERGYLEKVLRLSDTGEFDGVRREARPEFGVTSEGEPKFGNVSYNAFTGSKLQKSISDRITKIDELMEGLGPVDRRYGSSSTSRNKQVVINTTVPMVNGIDPAQEITGLTISGKNNPSVADLVVYYFTLPMDKRNNFMETKIKEYLEPEQQKLFIDAAKLYRDREKL